MPQIMGILNVTPDSFSDGGDYSSVNDAVNHALLMYQQGARWIDVGGESTRPGAEVVSSEQELQRVIPVIKALCLAIPDSKISIDTSKPEVMQAAVEVGATMVNDVRALQAPGALSLVSEMQVDVCLMHMQGSPPTMQQQVVYTDVVQEVKSFLLGRAKQCIEAGIKASRIIIDPGFGFGKSLAHNLLLLDQLDQFKDTGFKVLAGLSRKSMLGKITGQPVENRSAASLAAALIACLRGVDFIRVHDVAQTQDMLLVLEALSACRKGESNAT
ncbi:Dihydropteroate synthase [hydrothermal vent metagenome]|uniref:dihydropteroate synthase n=1 Tax=hydrothermal vent metagenome TaxID=652676 RepID=A0A3B0Z1B7_9ZZZZ